MDNGPVRQDFLPYALPDIGEEEIAAVSEVLRSRWLTRGPKTEEFEKDFARFIGVRHSIAVNSCTAGMHLALLAAGVGPGDEVITSPFTFSATANVIVHTGARPVFADIDEETFNIDPNAVQAAITPRTRAIIPVHIGGMPCEMDTLNEIARKHSLFVLEDAAHALYAQYKGRNAGVLGDAAAFSFYATKNLTTGEGGMVTTDNDELAEKMRVLSLHGLTRNAWNRYSASGSWYYEVLEAGFKYNMTDIQAALGIEQLKKLSTMQTLRANYASIYNEVFSQIPALIPPSTPLSMHRHAWHLYIIRIVENLLKINRDEFISLLNKENIGTSVHFIPLHLHPYYQQRWGYRKGDFPVAEKVFQSIISLPLYPSMSFQDINDVINAIKKIVKISRS